MDLFIALSTIGIGALLYICISLCRESGHVCQLYCEVTAIRKASFLVPEQEGNAQVEQETAETSV